jgi:hypothetical protein
MKNLFIAAFIGLLLFACGETDKQNKNKEDAAARSSVQANDDGGRYGVFTKNSSSMPINDIHAVWSDSENELVIYQTPSEITDDEKERLKNGETEFFVFSEKKSPDESKWQWYPFVVTELKFGPGEVNSANIESFYIMAFGIEQNNYTDNLNSFPSDKEKFEHVSFSNGELSINYFGESSIMESSYSWRVEK